MQTSAPVRRSDPEPYGLSVIAANNLWFSQRGRDCRPGQGDLLLHDTSQPFDSRALPGPGPGKMLMLQLPKAEQPLRPQRLNRLLARWLTADSGMNAILARYLTSVATAVEQGEVGEPGTRQLGTVALDLAAATLAEHADAQDQLAPETRHQALLARIEAFVEHNLADPDLPPPTTTSRRDTCTPLPDPRTDRRRLDPPPRLERCRADLADPQLRHHLAHSIGTRWGFRHAADFSRAFRTVHGMPPGDYRHQAMTTTADSADMPHRTGRRP
ncbi:AraC family transcriptional regulator [Streptomyces sp. cg40]|uniref:AraC-like ligand-binding domain-containing protein n=1 Tax=Streptomyces sp. cg40 TaxID=3419764 RepID=UPI003CFC3047